MAEPLNTLEEKRTWNIAMYRERIKYPKYKEPIEPELRVIG